MKFLPSKEQIIPTMLVAALTIAIIWRVEMVRKIVAGA